VLQQRRSWLILIVAMVVGILVISSCGPAATPETIVETVIETVEVEKTIIETSKLKYRWWKLLRQHRHPKQKDRPRVVRWS